MGAVLKNGEVVATFEREFAQYVGAKYAIACANGTVTLQAALVALGIKASERVAVPPLTMAATTIAVLNVGAVPVFEDVDSRTWLMDESSLLRIPRVPVSLYGLHYPAFDEDTIDDAAQTLRPHSGAAFTSYSMQASKVLSLGEGGMLVTNDEALASRARSYLSLGYAMRADQARIDPATLKAPTFERHHLASSINGRMNDVTAALGLSRLARANEMLALRREAAEFYAAAIAGCAWLTPQFVPTGWTHDYWCYAVACDTPARAVALSGAVVKHGGERPYACWRITYQEPAFAIHVPSGATSCPVAESLQPRLLQFATNRLASAEQNARALAVAIAELS